jgi:hypothetical protein
MKNIFEKIKKLLNHFKLVASSSFLGIIIKKWEKTLAIVLTYENCMELNKIIYNG